MPASRAASRSSTLSTSSNQPIWKCARAHAAVMRICGPPIATPPASVGIRPNETGASTRPASMKRHFVFSGSGISGTDPLHALGDRFRRVEDLAHACLASFEELLRRAVLAYELDGAPRVLLVGLEVHEEELQVVLREAVLLLVDLAEERH